MQKQHQLSLSRALSLAAAALEALGEGMEMPRVGKLLYELATHLQMQPCLNPAFAHG